MWKLKNLRINEMWYLLLCFLVSLYFQLTFFPSKPWFDWNFLTRMKFHFWWIWSPTWSEGKKYGLLIFKNHILLNFSFSACAHMNICISEIVCALSHRCRSQTLGGRGLLWSSPEADGVSQTWQQQRLCLHVLTYESYALPLEQGGLLWFQLIEYDRSDMMWLWG